MKNLITLFVAAALSCTAMAQQQFPNVTGETASGEIITLPKSDASKFTIVGLAYSSKASAMLDEWLEPAYLRFVAKHGLFAGEYDADIYFVPVFVGLNKTAYEPTIRKFKKTATPEIVDHVLFSKDDLDPLREQLGMDKEEIPHFFVLDSGGKILYRTEGAYTDEKLEAIEDILMD
ncbi:MAG: thioredoxin family protein [Bacteroidota bacterium]|nr:thioredoxin family protein [Bacteroidota bacterium]